MATLVGLSKQLERFYAPVKDQLRLIAEIRKSMHAYDLESLEETLQHKVLDPAESLRTLLPPNFSETNRFLKEVERNFGDIEQGWGELSDRVTEALLFLAEKGWFFPIFDKQIVTLLGFHELALEGDLQQLDRQMIYFFEKRFDEVKRYLVGRYPHRKHLLHSGIKAHRVGEYELAILAFFSQVDGFCWDAADCNYFRKNGGKPEISIHVDIAIHRKFAQAMLSALINNLPVAYNLWERKSTPKPCSGPNRHTIMHGEALDYGTKENSLKALSLLYYVALALEFAGVGSRVY